MSAAMIRSRRIHHSIRRGWYWIASAMCAGWMRSLPARPNPKTGRELCRRRGGRGCNLSLSASRPKRRGRLSAFQFSSLIVSPATWDHVLRPTNATACACLTRPPAKSGINARGTSVGKRIWRRPKVACRAWRDALSSKAERRATIKKLATTKSVFLAPKCRGLDRSGRDPGTPGPAPGPGGG